MRFSSLSLFISFLSGLFLLVVCVEKPRVCHAISHAPLKDVVICFDLDDVISGKHKIGFSDYGGLIPRLIIKSPQIIAAALPGNAQQIRSWAHELTKKMNGGTNVIHALIKRLKEEGYGDLSSCEKEFVKRSLNPFVIEKMIDHIRALKAQGYFIIGATNQDCEQHRVYRQKMKALGVDLNTLFHAVLTTGIAHNSVSGEGEWYRLNQSDNIYVVRDASVYKPSKKYFEIVRQFVQKFVPNPTLIVHTDDRLENVEGARAAGLVGLHFKLKNETARKTRKRDREITINTWRQQLKELSIIV